MVKLKDAPPKDSRGNLLCYQGPRRPSTKVEVAYTPDWQNKKEWGEASDYVNGMGGLGRKVMMENRRHRKRGNLHTKGGETLLEVEGTKEGSEQGLNKAQKKIRL